MTSMPTAVAGNLTMMFGASEAKWTPWSSIRSGVRQKVGFVCIERRPLRPPWRTKVGSSSRAPVSDISSTTAQAISTSVHSRFASAMARARAARRPDPSPDVVDDGRVGGRADRPEGDGVLELVDGARVVPDVGRRGGDGPSERRGGQGLGHGVPPKWLITA